MNHRSHGVSKYFALENMRAGNSRIIVTFLVAGAICAALVLFISSVIRKDSDPIEIHWKGGETGSAEEDPVNTIVFGSKEEQLRAAMKILDDPEAHRSRAGEISKVLEESKDPIVRVAVVKILGSMGNEVPEASEALDLALVDDKHHLVRLESAKALRSIHSEENQSAERAISAMSKALSDEEDEVALEAMRFLFDHPSRKATLPLLNYIERSEAKHRWKAVEVLGRIKDPESAPILLSRLQDESENIAVRMRACGVLGLLKYEPAEPVIRSIVESQPGTELGKVANETLKLFEE